MRVNKRQRGFSLIEVMVTMIILAVGLFGIMAMQTKAQQAEMESYQRSQAIILLDYIVERMRANRAFMSCYITTAGAPAYLGKDNEAFAGYACHSVADTDLASWNNMLLGSTEQKSGVNVGAMIGARGCITLVSAATATTPNIYRVVVSWQGRTPTVAPAHDASGDACVAPLTGQYGDPRLRRTLTYDLSDPKNFN